MLSRWRSKCFFNRPAKQVYALVYSCWFCVELARPFLKRQCCAGMSEHYYATHLWRDKRCRKSLFNGPARFNSETKGSWGYSYPLGPVFQAHSLIVEGEQTSLSSVVLLLLACCPTAVARFVVAIFVRVSVKRCVRGAWPHVCQEIEKGSSPPFVDDYSSPSISVIPSRIGAVASRLHHLPGIVLRTFPCRVPASFCLFARCNRIARSHLKLLHSFMVVRAESVVVDRLGSFHCALPLKAVQ